MVWFISAALMIRESILVVMTVPSGCLGGALLTSTKGFTGRLNGVKDVVAALSGLSIR